MNDCIFVINSGSKNELKHWKYIKKVKKNGKWRYYYDKDSLKSDIKKKVKSVADGIKNIYNDPNNIYDVNSANYKEKIKQIAKSKEWQDIVRRQDPEYVRKNADGSVTYMIDDYLLKKKHPELDAIYDVAYGRKISLNKITKESLVAGGKDYIKAAKTLLKLSVSALINKNKFVQGSYDDDISNISKRVQSEINRTNALANDTVKAAKTVANTTKTVNKGMDYVSKVQKIYDSTRVTDDD